MESILQRPKIAPLTGKGNWTTWSNDQLIYIRGKGNRKILTDDPPLDPSSLEDGLSEDQIKQWIREEEDIEEEKLTPRKINGNKVKATKALQVAYNDWEQRNNAVIMDLYYSCSANIQSLINKHPTAKAI